jgi:hypothetical protein
MGHRDGCGTGSVAGRRPGRGPRGGPRGLDVIRGGHSCPSGTAGRRPSPTDKFKGASCAHTASRTPGTPCRAGQDTSRGGGCGGGTMTAERGPAPLRSPAACHPGASLRGSQGECVGQPALGQVRVSCPSHQVADGSAPGWRRFASVAVGTARNPDGSAGPFGQEGSARRRTCGRTTHRGQGYQEDWASVRGAGNGAGRCPPGGSAGGAQGQGAQRCSSPRRVRLGEGGPHPWGLPAKAPARPPTRGGSR